jgi:hypothetical protein
MIASALVGEDLYEGVDLAADALYGKPGEDVDGQQLLPKKLAGAASPEAQRIAFACALAGHLDTWRKPDYLLEVAKARKIDPKKIAAALKAEAKTKAVELTAKKPTGPNGRKTVLDQVAESAAEHAKARPKKGRAA